MGWKKDKNLGPGSFNFSEQQDKWGYLNNPNWTKLPAAVEFSEAAGNPIDLTDRHKPCGHWHKRGNQVIPQPNLFGAGDNRYSQVGIPMGSTLFSQADGSLWSLIDCGYYHSAGIKTNGTLWTVGYNATGELGLGDNTNRYVLEQVGSGTNWAFVACGHYFTIAIKTDGTMWASGQNDDGQLGQGNTTDLNTFTQVGVATDWSSVACGQHQAMAIKTDGTLWGAGANASGLLGLGADASDRTTFTDTGMTGVALVSCGTWHSGLIKSDGSMWMTGDGSFGEHGDGLSQVVTSFTQVGIATDWSELCCAEYFSIALKTGGTLYATGDNSSGQLGQGDLLAETTWQQIGAAANWTDIDCGTTTTAAVNAAGELWSCGDNWYGQFGTDDYTNTTSLVQGEGSGYALVACGYQHSLAIMDDSTLDATGSSEYGQGGKGDYSHIDTLTLVDLNTWLAVDCWENFTVAIRSDRTLWGCGENVSGQLGQGWQSAIIYSLTQIGEESTWVQVATGAGHVILRKNDGTIWGAGSSLQGQLGQNDRVTQLNLVQIGSESNWLHIASGSGSTFAINIDGELWACGNNGGTGSGMLGLGDEIDKVVLTLVKSDDRGSDSSCASGTLGMGIAWSHDAINDEYDVNGYALSPAEAQVCQDPAQACYKLIDPGILVDGLLYEITVVYANHVDPGGLPDVSSLVISAGGKTGDAITGNGTYVQRLEALGTDLEFVATDTLIGTIQSYKVVEISKIWKQCSVGS